MFWLVAIIFSLARATDNVAILQSDDLARFQVPAQSFASSLNAPSYLYNLQGDREVALEIVAQLQEDPPSVIFAVGPKAAWTAANHLPGIPMVYAMVLDPARYGIGSSSTTGIQMELPPDLVVAQLNLMVPEADSLGLILSKDNDRPEIDQAIAAARRAGYEVHFVRVRESHDVKNAFDRIRRKTDAIWLLPDRTVLTPDNFHHMQVESLRTNTPILAYTAALVEAGALLCVDPDPAAVGQQAAEMVQQILNGADPRDLPNQHPNTPRVVLNQDTQELIRLQIDPVLLDFVDEVISAPARR